MQLFPCMLLHFLDNKGGIPELRLLQKLVSGLNIVQWARSALFVGRENKNKNNEIFTAKHLH